MTNLSGKDLFNKTDCKKCLANGGTGFWKVYVEPGDVEYLIGCSMRDRCTKCTGYLNNKYTYNMSLSGIPRMNAGKSFDDFVCTENWQKKLKHECRSYFEDFRENYMNGMDISWIMLAGQSGSGKTLLGSIIGNEILKLGVRLRYVNYQVLIESMRQFKHDPIEVYGSCEYLIIDDFLKKNPTDFEFKTVFGMVEKRYATGLPTMFLTERSIDDLQKIDGSLYFKIYERAEGYVVDIGRDPSKNMRISG